MNILYKVGLVIFIACTIALITCTMLGMNWAPHGAM